MEIVVQSAVLESITANSAQLLERAGRTCYQSSWKMLPGGESAAKFIEMIWRRGHHSVIEHGYATIRFVCDRGVTHEMVRHRLAAYSQESTRFCNYAREQFGGEIKVIEPPWVVDAKVLPDWMQEARRRELHHVWSEGMRSLEKLYFDLLALNQPPEIARSVLPTCLKTEIVMSANFREWLHFLHLRNAPGKAHPQMVALATMAEKLLVEACPEVFHLAERRRRMERATTLMIKLVGGVRDAWRSAGAAGVFPATLASLATTYDEYEDAA